MEIQEFKNKFETILDKEKTKREALIKRTNLMAKA